MIAITTNNSTSVNPVLVWVRAENMKASMIREDKICCVEQLRGFGFIQQINSIIFFIQNEHPAALLWDLVSYLG